MTLKGENGKFNWTAVSIIILLLSNLMGMAYNYGILNSKVDSQKESMTEIKEQVKEIRLLITNHIDMSHNGTRENQNVVTNRNR